MRGHILDVVDSEFGEMNFMLTQSILVNICALPKNVTSAVGYRGLCILIMLSMFLVRSKSPPAYLFPSVCPSSRPEGKSSQKDSESSFVRFPTESRNHCGLS